MRKYIPMAVAAMVLVAATTPAGAQAAPQQPKESSLKAAAQEYSFEIRPTTGLIIPTAPSGQDVGWNIGASFRVMPPTWPVGLQLDVMWLDLEGSIFQFTGDVLYAFGGSDKVKPYVIGGMGMYDGNFGLNAGLGADFAVSGSPIGFFGEARFHAVFNEGDNLNMIPINLGVRIRF